MAHIITLGNEKGGSGKSTTAMHVFAAAAHSGYNVGIIDLDLRQRSFLRYLTNREGTRNASGIALPMPNFEVLSAGQFDSARANKAAEEENFTNALHKLEANSDIIIIDCPGANTEYSKMAHSVADTLITPMNESFIDFDLLANIDPVTEKILRPSVYSEMVWEARKLRGSAGLEATDWIVVRNRMGISEIKNRRVISGKLKEFSKRIGFRTVPGLSERLIFRELFVKGLTLVDLPLMGRKHLSVSNVAARQEVRDLIKSLKLEKFEFTV